MCVCGGGGGGGSGGRRRGGLLFARNHTLNSVATPNYKHMLDPHRGP